MHGDESNDASEEFEAVTVNTDALVEDAYTRGYEQAIKDEGPKKFNEGYIEAIGDVMWRLKAMSDAGEGDFERCIEAIKGMKPD